MNTFKLSFTTDNSAFDNGDLSFEISRILVQLADKVGGGVEVGSVFRLRDSNGNTVGFAKAE